MAQIISVLCSPTMMKERTFVDDDTNALELCDTLSQGTNDDGLPLDPDFFEDRFRVDRKKLELMLQTPGPHDDEGAEDFFQRVMEETNTQITWPSKLKIGAKSKKDPHIKVIGRLDDVRAAKDKIMAILDTKSNRVTLKMDVSHTEHSHVIGKGGNNIKRVMHETGCHIHFPDSNRGNNVQEKSNQVSIAGQAEGVESARAQIRDLLPLVFTFELPAASTIHPIPDAASPSIQQIQQAYSVTIAIRQRPRGYITMVTIRGSVCNAKSVKEATARIVEQLTGNNTGVTIPVTMQLEIAPQHHLFMIGRGGMNVKHIMQRTGATIHFPDPSTVTQHRKGTVYITGSIDSVFMARQQLIGCLPLVLMFDVKEEVDIDQGMISQLMEQLDVFISIKPKPKQPSKSVIVKSIERNAVSMYIARLSLLGVDRDDNSWSVLINQSIQSKANIHTTGGTNGIISPPANGIANLPNTTGLGLSGLGFPNQNLLSINTTNSLLLVNGHSTPNNAPTSPMSTAANTPTQWPVTPGVYGPMMVLTPPPAALSVQLQLEYLLQCNGLHKDMSQNNTTPALICNQTPSEGGNGGHIVTPSQSPPQSNMSCETLPHTPTMQAADLQPRVIKKRECVSVIGQEKTSPSNSGHTMDLLGLSKVTTGSLLNKVNNSMSNGVQPRVILGQNAHQHERVLPQNNIQQHDATVLSQLSQNAGNGCSVQRSESVDMTQQNMRNHSSQHHGGDSGGGDVDGSIHAQQSSLQATLQMLNNHAQLLYQQQQLQQQQRAELTASGLYETEISPSAGLMNVTDVNTLLNHAQLLFLEANNLLPCLPSSMQHTDQSSESSIDSDGSDHRMPPGMDCKASSTFFDPSLQNPFDYEQKKLMANKAMQKKPLGESRTPTDFWSGLGFSKSMPESVIREKLAQHNMRFCGQDLIGPFVPPLPPDDDEDDIDRDPWKDSKMASPFNATPGEFPSVRRRCEFSLSNNNHVDRVMQPSKPIWPQQNTDLADLFSKLGLGKYIDLFQQQEIDLATFLTLTDQDLKELGITTFGARRKMLLAITDLNKRRTLFASSVNSDSPFTDAVVDVSRGLSEHQQDINTLSGQW